MNFTALGLPAGVNAANLQSQFIDLLKSQGSPGVSNLEIDVGTELYNYLKAQGKIRRQLATTFSPVDASGKFSLGDSGAATGAGSMTSPLTFVTFMVFVLSFLAFHF